jgi:hypothetical protein
MVLTIGLAVSPNGHPWCSADVFDAGVGVPTRSMITLVVSQKDANINQESKTLNILYSNWIWKKNIRIMLWPLLYLEDLSVN